MISKTEHGMPGRYCIVLKSHIPGSDIYSCKNHACSFSTLFSLDIDPRIIFTFKSLGNYCHD